MSRPKRKESEPGKPTEAQPDEGRMVRVHFLIDMQHEGKQFFCDQFCEIPEELARGIVDGRSVEYAR